MAPVETEMVRIENIKPVLHGISDVGAPVSCTHRLESGIYSPPSYMVRMVLSRIGGFRLFGPADKVDWIAYLRYKHVNFLVRDYKHSTWTVEADQGTEEAVAAYQELKRKITLAASQLDKALSETFKSKFASGEFLLNNPFPKVRSTYEYFRNQVLITRSNRGHVSLNSTDQARPETAVVMLGFAMVAFYYSALDTLLTVFLAFGDHESDYSLFREKKWRERFLTVLPVGEILELNRLYQELLYIKREIRDKILHGLEGDENILVHVEGIGLVPISYLNAADTISYSWLPLDRKFVYEAVQTFDEFDSWLADNPPWSCCVKYAQSGLAIPFYGKQLETIKIVIHDPDTFKEWLDDELRYIDYLRDTYR